MKTSVTRLAIELSPIEEEAGVHQALLGPACRLCGGVTRLGGIEPHPRDDHTDLRTYECTNCGHPFTIDVPLRTAKNGAKHAPSNQNEPQG